MGQGCRARANDWDPIRGLHQGQRSQAPRKQAGHMTCTRPQTERQILLAMKASSTHDPVLTKTASDHPCYFI
jgi:hypothetical protein